MLDHVQITVHFFTRDGGLVRRSIECWPGPAVIL